MAVDASDRDAGYYQSLGRKTFWDVANATLPDFHQSFAWAKALAESMALPVIFWQVPVGNMSLGHSALSWQDNRVDYFFAHMDELAGAHVLGALFGAGASDQTNPESDQGNLLSRFKAYAAAGGQPLCH